MASRPTVIWQGEVSSTGETQTVRVVRDGDSFDVEERRTDLLGAPSWRKLEHAGYRDDWCIAAALTLALNSAMAVDGVEKLP